LLFKAKIDEGKKEYIFIKLTPASRAEAALDTASEGEGGGPGSDRARKNRKKRAGKEDHQDIAVNSPFLPRFVQ